MNDVLPNDINAALQAVIAIVSAVVVPVLTNWLTARGADGATKQLVAGGLSLLVAVAAIAISGHLDLSNIFAGIVLAITVAKVAFEAFDRAIDPLHDTGPQLGAAKTVPTPSNGTSQS